MTDPETAARDFVLTEAGFAQVTTIDRRGFPVVRTMTVRIDAEEEL